METMETEIPTGAIPKTSLRIAVGSSFQNQESVASSSLADTSEFIGTFQVKQADRYQGELAKATGLIRNELASVEAMIRRELSSKNSEVDAMLSYVSELGGKRLRPSLLLLAANSVGVATDESIRLAVVVELVHTATLVHDDVLDDASMRRHKPTLHTKWSVPSSILSGDWLFAHAYGLANKGSSTIPGRWIADAAKQVCEGEILQGNSIKRFDISMEDQIKLLEAKTGALTAVSCALGAWSAGGSDFTCYRLQQYGLKLGTAFQVYDDWLDFWGDQDRAGKTLGTDLGSFKPTIPSLRALQVMCDLERVKMIGRLNQGDALAAEELRVRMENGDAARFTKSYARSLAVEAIQCLKGLPRNDAVNSLEGLATAAVERSG